MKTIVFVCTGNTCRSPMAAGIFRVLLEQRGITGIEAQSAGTSAFPGLPASYRAIKAAAAYGADITAHRSRPVTQEILDEGDLFVCMTERHYAMLAGHLSKEKLRVLGDGIDDPFEGDQDEYDRCAAQIHACLLQLIDEVQSYAD